MKNYNNLVCVVVFVGMALCFAFKLFGVWVLISLIAALVMAIVVWFLFMIKFSASVVKVRKESFRKCDPYIMLEWAETHKNDKCYSRKDYYFDCECCYSLLGDYQKAKEYLEMYGNLKLTDYDRLWYFIKKAGYCFDEGDSENGEEYLSCANEYAAKLKMKIYKKVAAESIICLRYCIEKDRGNCGNDIENYFLGEYEKAKFMAAKCIYARQLSEVYFNRGDYEKVKKYCEFVIANGNKLHCVEEARGLIEKAAERLGGSTGNALTGAEGEK